MPRDDNLNLPAAVLSEFFTIVQHQDGNVFDLDSFPLRNAFCPFGVVVVPSNGNRRSNFVQCVKNLGTADITGVKNEIDVLENLRDLGT